MTSLHTPPVLKGLRELPPLPAVVLELIQSLGNEGFGAEQLANTISRDQAIAAKTLQLANSSFYGLSRQVSTVAEATAILGVRTLRSVAMSAGLAKCFDQARCPGFDYTAFWRHSIGTAMCAASLARVRCRDEGLAFTLGLLHDIGRLVLACTTPVLYAAVVERQQRGDETLLESERAVLGTDHAAVGATVAEHWKFAPAVVGAIAEHHAPAAVDGNPLAPSQTDLLHVADNIAHALDLSHAPDDQVPPLSMAAWNRLALDERECRDVFEQTEAQHEVVCAALLS